MNKNFFPPKASRAWDWMVRFVGVATVAGIGALMLAIILGRYRGGWIVWGLFGCAFLSFGIAVYFYVSYLILYKRQQ